MMNTLRVNLFSSILLLLLISSCGTTPDKARMDADRMGVALDNDAFVGMDPNTAAKHGEPALVAAAKGGQTEAAELLLSKGADIEGRDAKSGGTALIWAARGGDVETVALLLDRGAGMEPAEEQYGQTALMAAAMMGHRETARLLLDKGARIERKDKDGKTPLIWAAWYGRAEAVELLLSRGANIDATDVDGRTALWWTGKVEWKNNRMKTREILRKAGAVAGGE